MNIAKARVGALCADSYPFSVGGTPDVAKAMRADGIEAVWGYLAVISTERVQAILDAGMAFLPVCVAGNYNAAACVQALNDLGIPSGATVEADLEGQHAYANPGPVRDAINAWADELIAAGFDPALYVGSPQPFNSQELWDLRVKGYHRGQGRIVSRFGSYDYAEPKGCGWWAYQAYPSQVRGGVLVDLDMITADYLGRVPMWVVP